MGSRDTKKASQPAIPPFSQDLLDRLPHPCWLGEATGSCRGVNRAWMERTGSSASQELPERWGACIHPLDREATLAARDSACRAGVPFTLEYRLKHADGSHRWVSDQGHPLLGGGGRVQGYLSSLFDVHQRHLGEARALRLGQLYQALGQVNRAVAQHLEPGDLFELACRVAVTSGRFRLAWVGLMDPQTQHLLPVAAAGAFPGLGQTELLALLKEHAAGAAPEANPSHGIVDRACSEKRYIICNDFLGNEWMAPWHHLAQQYELGATAAFPLLDRGKAKGVLALYAEERDAFDPEAVDLLARVAEDLSFSLERSDQTKRRQEVEGRLRASEGLFAATLDTLNASIAVLDERGRILAVNAAWKGFPDPVNALVFGLEPGMDYRGHCSRLLAENPDLAAPAAGSLEVMDGTREVFVGEYPCHGPSPMRWYATTLSRFFNEGCQRVVLAHRDVTKNKIAEERLRGSETLFRMIAENATDLIALTDATGLGLYFSPSHLTILGYSAEDLETHPALELIHPEDRERVRRTFQLVGGGGFDATGTEYRVIRKDGACRRFEAHLTAIPDALGGSTRVLVVGRDITAREAAERERQELEVQLRHSQKLESIGQLAAGIAHEINTPIQYIGDNLRFMKDGLRELFTAVDGFLPRLPGAGGLEARLLEDLKEALEKAEYAYLQKELPKAVAQSLEGVTRVSKIVGAMKEFSHPGSEEKTLADLNRGIESTVTVSRNEWKYVADLTMDLDPDLPPVPCLPSEINQVILNLVVNAAHAIAERVGKTGQRGTICVRTRQEGGNAVIQVEDSGAGIPEAVQSRVFDPFFTTKEVGKGSGQGLAIARSVVVDKHGGTIDFVSEAGTGTHFTIRLPMKAKGYP